MEKFTNTQCLPLQKRSGADPWNKYTWNKKEIKLIKIKTEWLLNTNYKDLAICRTYLPYSFHIIPISHNTMLNQKGWRHLWQTKWMVLTCTCTVIGSNKIFWNSKNIINPQCTNTEHTVRTMYSHVQLGNILQKLVDSRCVCIAESLTGVIHLRDKSCIAVTAISNNTQTLEFNSQLKIKNCILRCCNRNCLL